jgi:hypothetical protein
MNWRRRKYSGAECDGDAASRKAKSILRAPEDRAVQGCKAAPSLIGHQCHTPRLVIALAIIVYSADRVAPTANASRKHAPKQGGRARPTAAMTMSGERREPNSSRSIRHAASAARRRPSSTTSSRTRETRRSSGTGATGNPCVGPATRRRPTGTTAAASAGPADDRGGWGLAYPKGWQPDASPSSR